MSALEFTPCSCGFGVYDSVQMSVSACLWVSARSALPLRNPLPRKVGEGLYELGV